MLYAWYYIPVLSVRIIEEEKYLAQVHFVICMILYCVIGSTHYGEEEKDLVQKYILHVQISKLWRYTKSFYCLFEFADKYFSTEIIHFL